MEFGQHINEEKKVVCVLIVVWQFAVLLCFGKYYTKKKYKTGTQKFNLMPDRYSDIFNNCYKLLTALIGKNTFQLPAFLAHLL